MQMKPWRYLCTGGGFAGSLKTDKHNDVGLSLLGLPCFYSWINETCQLIHDGLCGEDRSFELEKKTRLILPKMHILDAQITVVLAFVR